MQLFVRTLPGKIITVDVDGTDTLLAMVKQQIANKAGVPCEQQRLVFAGKQVEDDCTLAEYGITSACTLHLALRVRGGGHAQRRRKVHQNKKIRSNDYKTRRFNANQMPDQIYDDIQTGRKNNQPLDLDLPGNGQFYCVSCAKYFKNMEALEGHNRSKLHKRLLKVLREEPHRGEALPIDNGADYGHKDMAIDKE